LATILKQKKVNPLKLIMQLIGEEFLLEVATHAHVKRQDLSGAGGGINTGNLAMVIVVDKS